MSNKFIEEEKKDKSQEQEVKTKTKRGVSKLKEEVGETIKKSEKEKTKGKLNKLKEEVGEKNKEPKKKYRRWREKYKQELEKIGISLTNDDRESIIKKHDKKEFKHFYKDLKKAIKKDEIDKILKKWKNKGFDDLLTKLSEKDKKKEKNKDKKNSDKEKKKKNSDESTNNSGESHETTDSSKESKGEIPETTNDSTELKEKTLEITVEVGEAANIPKNERMKRLFPEGIPQSKEEMQKYLTKIEVPVRTPDGQEDKLKLNIHSKLASEYEAIFKEMYDKNIPVNPKKTGGFCWRKMRKGSKMSHHSYGSAVDVNYNVNGGVYGKTDKSSPYYNDSETVAIRKKHGFYRGGDRSKNYNDPMHFTYMNA